MVRGAGRTTGPRLSGWHPARQATVSDSLALARIRSTGAASLGWSEFGLTTLCNTARRCKTTSDILAGQPLSAQVTGAPGTVYGSDSPVQIRSQGPEGHPARSGVDKPGWIGVGGLCRLPEYLISATITAGGRGWRSQPPRGIIEMTWRETPAVGGGG